MNSMLDLMEAIMTRLMPLQDQNVKFAGTFMTPKRGMIIGKPFANLPDHWTCPNCDGKKDEFMVVKD